MNSRITVTVGISNSGKSTWAHEQWKKDPSNVVIVNRDKIRELLYGYTEESIKNYYAIDNVYSMEKQVTQFEDTLIDQALQAGKDVIVDATHLKRKYLERFKFWNVTTELKTFPIDLQTAISRDMKRNRQVGETSMIMQLESLKRLEEELVVNPVDFTPVKLENSPKKIPCVIFDVDGTLAHMKDRSPYDWKRVGEDKVDKNLRMVLDPIEDSFQIFICTGRDGVALFNTKRWLTENGIFDYRIFIRKEGDNRPDWVVKEEMWRKISETHYIVGMFDDRQQVVRRARSLGLKVFDVANNSF